MMKRFSWLAFAVATALHCGGTLLLIQAGFWADKATHSSESFTWIAIWSWVWWPLPRLIWILFPLSHGSQEFFLLAWSLCVGALFGLVVPRFSIWRRQII
jgi:hypothetical protein